MQVHHTSLRRIYKAGQGFSSKMVCFAIQTASPALPWMATWMDTGWSLDRPWMDPGWRLDGPCMEPGPILDGPRMDPGNGPSCPLATHICSFFEKTHFDKLEYTPDWPVRCVLQVYHPSLRRIYRAGQGFFAKMACFLLQTANPALPWMAP